MNRFTQPYLLSDQGSDRATAYAFSNKAITLAGKTHVVWTDAIALTRGRTFDHATKKWSDTITIGEGMDNHNSPSLTADAQGRLHIAYGPHGRWGVYPDNFAAGTFKYHTAETPGSLEALQREPGGFGYAATYPCLIHTSYGQDAIVYRGGEAPWTLMFQQTTERNGWSQARPLMRQDIEPQYTHVGAMLSCGLDGALYAAGHFYCMKRSHSLGVAVLKSVDQGQTWTDMTGAAAVVPILYDQRFAVPHVPAGMDPRLDGMALDSRGRLWVLTSAVSFGTRAFPLSCWDAGRWRTVDVSAFVPAGLAPVNAAMCIDMNDRIHIAATTYDIDAVAKAKDQAWWGHASLEVAHLVSEDGGRTFAYQRIGHEDSAVPNWLPTISRGGPHHPVDKPVILYTHGQTGGETNPQNPCRPTTRTDVLVVWEE